MEPNSQAQAVPCVRQGLNFPSRRFHRGSVPTSAKKTQCHEQTQTKHAKVRSQRSSLKTPGDALVNSQCHSENSAIIQLHTMSCFTERVLRGMQQSNSFDGNASVTKKILKHASQTDVPLSISSSLPVPCLQQPNSNHAESMLSVIWHHNVMNNS